MVNVLLSVYRKSTFLVATLVVLDLNQPVGLAQPVVPPEAIAQFQSVIGNRVEAISILAGDYAAASGIYTFRGGTLADVSISKVGGGGVVAAPRPLGLGDLEWAPVLQGNIGLVSADNHFATGYLEGNDATYRTLAVAGGGGVAIYFNEHLSLAPTLSGIYGHVENEFRPQNANGDLIKTNASGTLVDWTMQTWSVVPGLELDYQWNWRRTVLQLSSRYSFFHTESYQSTSPILTANGNSSTWENKLDVDVPLGLNVFGRELHTGGFLSRTELYGDAAAGLNTGHVTTVNSRLVLDFLGDLWVVRWVGLGASYFWGQNMGGWTVGLDLRLSF